MSAGSVGTRNVDEEGLLFWEGRLTDIIETGGANISPLEVDAVLAAISGVKRAQTVGVPHETLSEMSSPGSCRTRA